MAVLVALLLGASALPLPAAETERPRGFLVFSDTLPVGPGLDATFHVVVPDGVEVLSASLDLWGRLGTLPVEATTSTAGEHSHILSTTGDHSHGTEEAGAHNQTASLYGEHSHTVQVAYSDITLNASRMSVTLPSHSHIPFGSMVVGYDFAAETSLEHNHTALEHDHQVTVTNGLHGHTSSTEEDHVHTITVDGEHSHVSSTLGEHAHTILPGVSPDPSGSFPTGVTVTLESASMSTTLDEAFDGTEAGWHASADLQGLIGDGVTRVALSASTDGAIEYILVLGVDTPCSVLTGNGVVGPLAPLEVPVYSPDVPTAATAYLFGAPQPAIVPSLDLAQDHEHTVVEDGAHAHTLEGAGSHTHDTEGGDHTHNTTVGNGSVTVADTTPDWNLMQHSHALTWTGNQITSVGNYGYGTVESAAHTHTVLGHDHSVTLTSSGEHEHTLTDVAGHTHTMDQNGAHTHDVAAAGEHSHMPVMRPTATTGPGPSGVRAALDGSDLTGSSGGPWELKEEPVEVALPPASLVGQHVLRLTSSTDGAAEWVVVLMHAHTRLVASLRSVGDLAAHVPVPVGALSAEARVFASPYIMPVQPTSSTDGAHSHTTSEAGAHDHDASPAGTHVHGLDSTEHEHSVLLANTTVTVDNSTGIVDLPTHTHTVTQGNPATGVSRVTGTTGTHTHTIDDHVHDVVWASSGVHDHAVGIEMDHVHALTSADDHAHTMSGGSHDHSLTPAAMGDASYPSPSDVIIAMGAAIVTGLHPAQDATWWEVTDLSEGLAGEESIIDLNATSGTLGTLNVIVVLTLDTEPPVLSLAAAPQWVRPGQAFNVSVAASVDIDPATIVLESSAFTALSPTFNSPTQVFDLACVCPTDVHDGVYPMTARGADMAGNPFEGVIGSIIVDGTPPLLSVRAGARSHDNGTFMVVSRDTDVVATLTDAGSGPSAIMYGPDSGHMDALLDPSSPYPFENLADGMHELHFVGYDLAGNRVATPVTMRVMVDGTPPSLMAIFDPSYKIGDPASTVIGPISSLLVFSDDGPSGSGVSRIEYAVTTGDEPPAWHIYEWLTNVLDDVTGAPISLRLLVRSYDLVGNEANLTEDLSVDWVGPDVKLSSFDIPERTNSSHLAVGSILDMDAVLEPDIMYVDIRVIGRTEEQHYPYPSSVIGGRELTLYQGVNTLEFTFTDGVGNSETYSPGAVVYDPDAPTVVSASPLPGSMNMTAGTLHVDLAFSEAIDRMTFSPRILVDGVLVSPIEVNWGPEGFDSATLKYNGNVKPSSEVEVRLAFKDLAGNRGLFDMTFWTTGGEEQNVNASDFVWGLFIGLVLGMVVAYLIVLYLRRGSSRHRPPGPRPMLDMGLRPSPSILAPEEDRLDGLAMDVPRAERTAGVSALPVGDDIQVDSHPSGEVDVPAKAPPRPEEGAGHEAGHGTDVDHHDDDEVDSELSADLDRLIAQASLPSRSESSQEPPDDEGTDEGEEVEHLPDPDEETVDPGTR